MDCMHKAHNDETCVKFVYVNLSMPDVLFAGRFLLDLFNRHRSNGFV